MIVGITGYCEDASGNKLIAGAGKDAVADVLISQRAFVRIGLADPLKRICQDVFEFTDDQLWGPSELRNAPDTRYLHAVIQAGHMLTPEALAVNPSGEIPQYLTPRHALQQLGTEWGRHCFNDVWINYAMRVAKKLEEGHHYYDQRSGLRPWTSFGETATVAKKDVVFSDLRFYNEYDAVRAGGGKVVRVKRKIPTVFSDSTIAMGMHKSELELVTRPDSEFDYILENTGDLHYLALLTLRMHDVLTGRIIPFDTEQADVPPYMRK